MTCFALLFACFSASASALLRSSIHSAQGAELNVRDGGDDDWITDVITMDTALNATADSFAKASPKPAQVGGWCPRSRWIVPSAEDVLAGRQACSDSHLRGSKEFAENPCTNPYGRWFRNQATGKTYYYVEIPKTGSTSVKSAIESYVTEQELNAATEQDTLGIEAFAFVRHPVSRFISGYGTFIQRAQETCTAPELAFLFEDEEPQRFNKFVDVFIKHGSDIVRWVACEGFPCLPQHVLSQTWFLNLWPGEVKLFHTESFMQDMRAMAEITRLPLTLPHENSHEGELDTKLLLQQHGAVQKLHDYFKDEMGRFQYKPLLGHSM